MCNARSTWASFPSSSKRHATASHPKRPAFLLPISWIKNLAMVLAKPYKTGRATTFPSGGRLRRRRKATFPLRFPLLGPSNRKQETRAMTTADGHQKRCQQHWGCDPNSLPRSLPPDLTPTQHAVSPKTAVSTQKPKTGVQNEARCAIQRQRSPSCLLTYPCRKPVQKKTALTT